MPSLRPRVPKPLTCGPRTLPPMRGTHAASQPLALGNRPSRPFTGRVPAQGKGDHLMLTLPGRWPERARTQLAKREPS